MNKRSLTLFLTSLAAVSFCQTSSAQTTYGLNTNGLGFVTFEASTPGTVSATTAITSASFQVGETITAIDFRPSNQTLYGYSSANRLFTIQSNGSATLATSFGTVATPPAGNGVGSDVPSPTTPTQPVSIDVNPNVPAGGTVGALRIVDLSGGNLRYAFSNDTLNRDDTLTYSTGGVPQVVGVAYTNNDLDPLTATSLYYLDAATDSLYATAAPNDGLLTLVGSLGFNLTTSDVGFDIPLFGTTNAFASFNGSLYSINLGTGSATLIGAIGGPVTDIAMIPEPTTGFLLVGGLGALFLFRRRFCSGTQQLS